MLRVVRTCDAWKAVRGTEHRPFNSFCIKLGDADAKTIAHHCHVDGLSKHLHRFHFSNLLLGGTSWYGYIDQATPCVSAGCPTQYETISDWALL